MKINLTPLLKALVLIGLIGTSFTSFSQRKLPSEIVKVKDFDKVVVSPLIEVKFVKGNSPSVEYALENLNDEDLVIKNDGKTLRLFLKGARITHKEKNNNGMSYAQYPQGKVRAIITYTELRKVQLRGEAQVEFLDDIVAQKFTLKSYGENDIYLPLVNAEKLKLSMFGESRIKTSGGKVKTQLLNLYGEHVVFNSDLESDVTRIRAYGESQVSVNANDLVNLHAMGESEVDYTGSARLNRSFTIGDISTSKNRMYSYRQSDKGKVKE